MSEDSNKLDQQDGEITDAGKLVEQGAEEQSPLPLFLRNKSEGNRDSAQDEKDESAE